MQKQVYKNQVALLLDVLPEVAKETCFAMHGGTAINLFVRNMPRLSVDIDLTYIEIADRKATIDAINAALARIGDRLTDRKDAIQFVHKKDVCKRQVSRCGVEIKLEVNLVGLGVIDKPVMMALCDNGRKNLMFSLSFRSFRFPSFMAEKSVQRSTGNIRAIFSMYDICSRRKVFRKQSAPASSTAC